jgi:hypothetical protein
MKTSVQARLDEETQAALDRLRRSGMTTSEVIRQGICLVEKQRLVRKRPRLAGIGCVDFGPGDLATNRKHMEDFGRKSMGKGWIPPEDRAE